MSKKFKDRVRRIKWLFRVARGRDLYFRPRVRADVEKVGGEAATGYGAWPVCVDGLHADSVVYSVGIGRDISFDLALIDRFGLKIHAFDPTPASLAWLEEQALPDGFILHPVGIAGYDGTAEFHAPANPQHVSYSMSHRAGNFEASVEVEVHRISTLMEVCGHASIDVLKMDIEGGEYEVIDDLIASGAEVKQLLVEFHHRLHGLDLSQTKDAVAALDRAGFKLAHISSTGEEYVFLRQPAG